MTAPAQTLAAVTASIVSYFAADTKPAQLLCLDSVEEVAETTRDSLACGAQVEITEDQYRTLVKFVDGATWGFTSARTLAWEILRMSTRENRASFPLPTHPVEVQW